MAQGQLRSLKIFLMNLEFKERNLFKNTVCRLYRQAVFSYHKKITIFHFLLQINVVKGGFFYGDTGKGL